MAQGNQKAILSLKIISKLKSLLKDKVKFALVYGSIIKDNFNKESDIDIAVFLNDFPKSYEQITNFKLDIYKKFEKDIDMIILNNSDIIITLQVLANGKLIINNDNSFFVLFKAKKISEYLDFKISRKIIEDNLLNRKLYV